jgi:uncharacterized membrane protein YozB (DUF420 family)
MPGFLGTRGDFMSDLLIVALAGIVPSLAVGAWLARKGRLLLHRRLMLVVYNVVVLYVVVYEANMLWLGGMDYLRGVVRIPEGFYFAATAAHIALGVAALVLGAVVIRRGRAAWASCAAGARPAPRVHAVPGWWELSLLALSAVSGVALYWLTFVA